ncbi:MAG: lipoyltransferase [Bacteroides sp.]|nr:lipoyltransferase [Bacteroides sp.]
MIHLKLPFREPRRLPFYLAMEEWAARTLPANDYFFCWRVKPTVICGRNQEMDKEVDMAYCREAGIDVVRRRSGGGCVYADLDNFMMSYICPGDEVTSTFARYTTMIASMLQEMGLDAVATGRNDIVISGKKVSGNAFYHIPGRCIAHGTMLYDFDPSVMKRAITPSRAKLESKSVKSVESRVTCLTQEGMTMSHDEFEERIIRSLCDKEILLSDEDVAAVEAIEKTYYDPEFLYRKGELKTDPAMPELLHRHGRVDGVGEIDFTISLDSHDRISRIEASGDFFLIGDPEELIFRHLKGSPLTGEEILKALSNAEPQKAISGLDKESLTELLIGNVNKG